MWTLSERDAMEKALLPHSALRTALEKFCADRTNARRNDCAECMQSVPRKYELASDYSAKASVYDELLSELERQCEQEAQ